MWMSYVFYRRPANAGWTVDAAGADFVGDVLLSSGNPGEETMIRWRSDAVPDVAHYVSLRIDFPAGMVLLGAWLLGLRRGDGDFPLGVRFEVWGRRTGDPGYTYPLGGNTLSEVSRSMPDGSVGICWAFDDGLDAVVGVEIRIYNDADGVTWADADTHIRIGEGDVAEGVRICIAHGFQDGATVGATSDRTKGQQLHEVEGVDYRVLEFARVPTDGDKVYRQALPNGMDWTRINRLMTRAGARTMVYVRTQDEAGNFDSAELHSTATFGACRPDPNVHVVGTRGMYSGGYRLDEVPVIV